MDADATPRGCCPESWSVAPEDSKTCQGPSVLDRLVGSVSDETAGCLAVHLVQSSKKARLMLAVVRGGKRGRGGGGGGGGCVSPRKCVAAKCQAPVQDATSLQSNYCQQCDLEHSCGWREWLDSRIAWPQTLSVVVTAIESSVPGAEGPHTCQAWQSLGEPFMRSSDAHQQSKEPSTPVVQQLLPLVTIWQDCLCTRRAWP